MEEKVDMTTALKQKKSSYGSMMTGESDPMIKDKKRLELSGYEVIPLFLLNILIIFPIWFVLLLPLALIYQALYYIWNASLSLLGMNKKKKSSRGGDISITTGVAVDTKVVGKRGERELDLIIFGATGFTGQMAATYIAKRYGSTFKWAIAGRRMSALQALRSQLSTIDTSLGSLPIIIADTGDLASLEKMVKETKVIISTTGDYERFIIDKLLYGVDNYFFR